MSDISGSSNTNVYQNVVIGVTPNPVMPLSDKSEGEFTAEHERKFVQCAHLISMHLETLWQVRNLQKASAEIADHSD